MISMTLSWYRVICLTVYAQCSYAALTQFCEKGAIIELKPGWFVIGFILDEIKLSTSSCMFVSVSAREQAVRYRRAAISLFLEQVKPRLTTTSRAILF